VLLDLVSMEHMSLKQTKSVYAIFLTPFVKSQLAMSLHLSLNIINLVVPNDVKI
jgi:hypothetical protein